MVPFIIFSEIFFFILVLILLVLRQNVFKKHNNVS